jgi:hypothetical protein
MSSIISMGYGPVGSEAIYVSIEDPGRFEVFFKDAGEIPVTINRIEPIYASVAEIGSIYTRVETPESVSVALHGVGAIYVTINEVEGE